MIAVANESSMECLKMAPHGLSIHVGGHVPPVLEMVRSFRAAGLVQNEEFH